MPPPILSKPTNEDIRRLPTPNVLAIPPMFREPPSRNAQEGAQEDGQQPPSEEMAFRPGPWCFGADSICAWLYKLPLVGDWAPTACRVTMNVLCLLIGLILLVGLTALLLYAFIQPG